MSDETNNEKVAGCALFLLWVPIAVLLRGFTISKLWAWFMVPLFALRPLGIAGSIGLSLVITLFTFHAPPKSATTSTLESAYTSIASALLICGLALLEGWIVAKYI